MLKTTGYISRSNHDTVNKGEKFRAAGAEAAVHIASTVRKQRKTEERLFSVHFLFLYNPGS